MPRILLVALAICIKKELFTVILLLETVRIVLLNVAFRHYDTKPIIGVFFFLAVLLAKDGVPKISDFGMSRKVQEEAAGKTASVTGPICWVR
jgi:hypothetical protein